MGLRCDRDRLAHAAVADAAALRLTSWDIRFRCRIDAELEDGDTAVVIAKGGLNATSQSNFHVSLRRAAGVTKWWFAYTHSGGTTYETFITSIPTTVGQWARYKVQLQYAGGATDLTVERQAEGAAAATSWTQAPAAGGTPDATTAALRFGADETASAVAQNGADVSLSDVELRNYAGTLIARWRLDDGMGGVDTSTAYDSENGYVATLTNRPHWCDDPYDLIYPCGRMTAQGSGSTVNDGLYVNAWKWAGLGFIAHSSAVRRPGAALTASTEASGYPASNLLCPSAAVKWRSTGTSDTLTIDAGQPVPMFGLTIDGHNLSSGAAITVSFDTSNSFSPALLSEAPLPHYGRIRHIFARPYRFRWVQIAIADSGNADGYIELGAVHLWTAVEFHRAVEMEGETYPITDPSGAVVLQHGHRITRTLARGRGVSLSLPDPDRSHSLELREVLRRVGGGQPVWICADAARGLYPRSVYGYLSAGTAVTLADPSWDAESISGISVEEDRP